MRRAGMLLCLLAACAAKRARETEALMDRGRSLPLENQHSAAYLQTWREIRDRAREPEHRAEAHYRIGCAHQRLGEKTPAAAAFERAAAVECVHPCRTLALYLLAGLRHERGDVRGAVEAIDGFLAAPPVNRHWTAAAGYLKGEWLAQLGETDRAKEALRTFLAANEAGIDRWNGPSVKAAWQLLDRLEDRS